MTKYKLYFDVLIFIKKTTTTTEPVLTHHCRSYGIRVLNGLRKLQSPVCIIKLWMPFSSLGLYLKKEDNNCRRTDRCIFFNAENTDLFRIQTPQFPPWNHTFQESWLQPSLEEVCLVWFNFLLWLLHYPCQWLVKGETCNST